MAKVKDLTGKVFGKLSVIGRSVSDKRGRALWVCKCECGIVKNIRGSDLISENTRSCGMCYDFRGENLIGKRYGKLVILDIEDYDKNKIMYWLCVCDCGNKIVVGGGNLKSGKTKSCGCLRKEIVIAKNTIHNQRKTKIYQSWAAIKNRVKSKGSYIKQGIRVCCGYREDYFLFKKDLGEVVGNKNTVDRIDTHGHYSCGKCGECKENGWVMNIRWANMQEQSENKTNNDYYTYNGETKCLTAWAREYGLKPITLRNRLKDLGWTIEKALSLPSNGTKKIVYNGIHESLSYWAEKYNLNPNTLGKRIYGLGWSIEKALTTPVDESYSRNFKNNS